MLVFPIFVVLGVSYSCLFGLGRFSVTWGQRAPPHLTLPFFGVCVFFVFVFILFCFYFDGCFCFVVCLCSLECFGVLFFHSWFVLMFFLFGHLLDPRGERPRELSGDSFRIWARRARESPVRGGRRHKICTRCQGLAILSLHFSGGPSVLRTTSLSLF